MASANRRDWPTAVDIIRLGNSCALQARECPAEGFCEKAAGRPPCTRHFSLASWFPASGYSSLGVRRPPVRRRIPRRCPLHRWVHHQAIAFRPSVAPTLIHFRPPLPRAPAREADTSSPDAFRPSRRAWIRPLGRRPRHCVRQCHRASVASASHRSGNTSNPPTPFGVLAIGARGATCPDECDRVRVLDSRLGPIRRRGRNRRRAHGRAGPCDSRGRRRAPAASGRAGSGAQQPARPRSVLTRRSRGW